VAVAMALGAAYKELSRRQMKRKTTARLMADEVAPSNAVPPNHLNVKRKLDRHVR
jgi:hypothetical protein